MIADFKMIENRFQAISRNNCSRFQANSQQNDRRQIPGEFAALSTLIRSSSVANLQRNCSRFLANSIQVPADSQQNCSGLKADSEHKCISLQTNSQQSCDRFLSLDRKMVIPGNTMER
ncbi:hypothetical protein CDAR_173481 [Caerostris darwini]|uniref:Uncharacterized protein n=1 Tax=Caerostris darwini TaxID=1538125 RepID=A0AAV4WYW4_9ARAC|nr:hypothetical protein CDAR_173481 [Caerostris darwini]